MKDSIEKNRLFALVHLLSGVIGILLISSWLVFNNDKQFLAIAILVILGLFSSIMLGGGIVSLRQASSRRSFSPAVRRYHSYVIIIGTVVWLILMPAMLGLGVGQLFFILSGFSLYVLPSIALFILNRFIAPVSDPQKPWREWMQENALEKSLKE